MVWGKVILSVDLDEEGVIPLTEEDYSERGEQMRQLNFLDVKHMNGRRIPTRIECLPLRKPGQKTEITYHKLEFNVDFPSEFFGMRNLQKPLQ